MTDDHPVVAAFFDVLMVPKDWLSLRRQRTRPAEAATGRVLEIGVGAGLNLWHFTETRRGFRYRPDPTMLKRAARRATRAPRPALREAHRVLKPDGSLVFLEHVRSPHPAITARLQDWITPYWRRVSGGCHTSRSTLDTISDNGLEITRLWRSKRGSLVQGDARINHLGALPDFCAS